MNEILENVFAQLGTKERGEQLTAMACGVGALGGPSAFGRILKHLGRAGVAIAVRAYLQARSLELRDSLNKFLTANVVLAPEELVVLIEPKVPADMARWALFLASKSLKGPAADRMYEEGKQHPAPRVREYANFLWRTQTTKGRIRAFIEALEAPDVAERIRAAETLAKAQDAEAIPALMRLIEDEAFLARTPEEKKAFLAALTALGGFSVSEFLHQQTNRQTSIFRRRAGEEVRDEAERALRKLRGLTWPPESVP